MTKHNSFSICLDYMVSVSIKHSDCKALNWNFSYSMQHSTRHSLSSRGREGSKHEPSLSRARKERRDPENYRPVKKMPKLGKLIKAIIKNRIGGISINITIEKNEHCFGRRKQSSQNASIFLEAISCKHRIVQLYHIWISFEETPYQGLFVLNKGSMS